jgi:hypothetical protein
LLLREILIRSANIGRMENEAVGRGNLDESGDIIGEVG